MNLIFLHHKKISIWNFIDYLFIRKAESLYKRCDLTEHTLVSNHFGFAIRILALFCKPDSFIKFVASIIDIAASRASTTSVIEP